MGNAHGGRAAAILASLATSCRRHEIDPQVYLTQLLVNLQATRTQNLTDRLLDRWKVSWKTHLAALQNQAPHS